MHYSSIVTIEIIEHVRQHRDFICSTCFTPEEISELKQRHVRSTAGNLALKRAVLSLLSGKWGIVLQEQDVIISRLESGAPRLLDLKPGKYDAVSAVDFDFLFLSISHTKTKAYGLAVYQERTYG